MRQDKNNDRSIRIMQQGPKDTEYIHAHPRETFDNDSAIPVRGERSLPIIWRGKHPGQPPAGTLRLVQWKPLAACGESNGNPVSMPRNDAGSIRPKGTLMRPLERYRLTGTFRFIADSKQEPSHPASKKVMDSILHAALGTAFSSLR